MCLRRTAVETLAQHTTEGRMKYILLVYCNPDDSTIRSSGDCAASASACQANDEALRTSGHVLAVEKLQHGCPITIVRVQHNHAHVHVQPLAETERQLVEIFTIAARDLNEAIQLAVQMPQARRGLIEVRSVADFEGL